MNYYPHNIGDFASLTQGLDLEAVGIVVRLLDRLMLTEKPIKTQWVSIGFPKEANDKVMAVLAALFEETPDGWIYPPAIEAIEAYQRNCLKNQENGKKGGRPRKSQQEPTGFSEETQGEAKKSLTNNQEPITKNQRIESTDVLSTQAQAPASTPVRRRKTSGVSSVEKPDEIPAQVWSDWLQIRKAKRLPLTKTAWDAMCVEAEKVGFTPAEAVKHAVERGWAGFKASWYENDRSQDKAGSSQEDPGFGWL